MTLVLFFAFFSLGLFILVKGADYLVEGASSVAYRFKISTIVIGLTIVAFGTSAPELVVSVTSALRKSTDIALGNVVGSNLFNILGILGVSSLLYPLSVKKNTVWKEIPMSFLGAVMLLILGIGSIIDNQNWQQVDFLDKETKLGYLGVSAGLVLLSFFVIFMYYTFGIAKIEGEKELEQENIKEIPFWKSFLFIFVGLASLFVGGRLAVDNAVRIASLLGLSERLIGLTIVAVGTSLPELVTSVVASSKQKADIVIGNVVGSNIFNIFMILGLTALVNPIPIYGQNLLDILILILVSTFLFAAIFVLQKYRLSKIEGTAMILLYVAYTAFLMWRG